MTPNGSGTNVYYDYGLTTGFGSSVVYGNIGSGMITLSVPKNVSGLSCGTTYHFRARATNSGGTTYGNDQTFTTSACLHHILEVNTNGNGMVSSNPAGIDCGSDCSESFEDGTSVDLSVTSEPGWYVSDMVFGASPTSSTLSHCEKLWILNSLGGDPTETTSFTCQTTMDRDRTITATFSQKDPILPGDVDGNGVVELKDAILALQVACGITPSETVYLAADVNGDGKIGLEEVMYILQKISSLK